MLLIRHAESEGNVAKVLQGQQEHALSPRGRQQAQTLGDFLEQQSWQPTHIYSSPLQRTLETASYCVASTSPRIQTHLNLIEIHNGVLQGLTWQAAQKQYPQLCQTLEQSSTWISIPESESPSAAFERAQAFIQWMLQQHQNGDRIWVFSHGGIMQHLVAQIIGSDRVWGISIPPTGLFEFEIDLDHWDTATNDRFTGHLFRVTRFNQLPSAGQS